MSQKPKLDPYSIQKEEAHYREWMLLYQRGDMVAFDQLYQAFSPKVYAYLQNKIRQPGDVDDVFQKIFAKFHQVRHQYDPGFPVLSWVFTISRTVLLDHFRESARHHRNREDIELETVADGAPVEGDGLRVPEIELEALTARERDAVQFRYYEDLGFDEIAKKLSLSESNVRQILSRAIRRLRAVSAGRAR